MNRLKELREASGLSQSQLAKKADVNVWTIQSYETGRRSILKAEIGIMHKLAKALDVQIEDFIKE